MTVKVNEVITDALEDINELAADETIDPDDAAAAVRYLNDMMFELDVFGIHLGFTRVSGGGDIVTVADGAIAGVKSNLSLYCADKFDSDITANLIRRAKRGYKAMRNISQRTATQRYPSILPMGSGNTCYGGYTSVHYPEYLNTILTETGGSIALETNTEESL